MRRTTTKEEGQEKTTRKQRTKGRSWSWSRSLKCKTAKSPAMYVGCCTELERPRAGAHVLYLSISSAEDWRDATNLMTG